MGKNPPEWLMQTVIGVTGLGLLVRNYCISRFPEDVNAKQETPDLRKALRISVSNGPLTAYSVYVCLLTIANSSLGPVTYIYLREYVKFDPGMVQRISAVGMAGHILGFLLYNKLLKLFGMKKTGNRSPCELCGHGTADVLFEQRYTGVCVCGGGDSGSDHIYRQHFRM